VLVEAFSRVTSGIPRTPSVVRHHSAERRKQTIPMKMRERLRMAPRWITCEGCWLPCCGAHCIGKIWMLSIDNEFVYLLKIMWARFFIAIGHNYRCFTWKVTRLRVRSGTFRVTVTALPRHSLQIAAFTKRVHRVSGQALGFTPFQDDGPHIQPERSP
jgi:hypothetical protein